MAVRTSMSGVIARVRELINDPSPETSTSVFTDQVIQDACDVRRQDFRDFMLRGLRTTLPGGVVLYLNFQSPLTDGYWENTVQLQDGGWNNVTADNADLLVGQWDFNTQPVWPIVLTGRWYDTYQVAADLLDQWLSKIKMRYSFSSDGQNFQIKEQIANLTLVRDSYRAKKKNLVAKQRRSDIRTQPISERQFQYPPETDGWLRRG